MSTIIDLCTPPQSPKVKREKTTRALPTATPQKDTEAGSKTEVAALNSTLLGPLRTPISLRNGEAHFEAKNAPATSTLSSGLPIPPLQNATEASPRPASFQSLHTDAPQEITEDEESPFLPLAYPPPVPVPSSFIQDPGQRTEQCIKVLCGNVGILAVQSITLKIGQLGIKNIQQNVMEILDTGFFDWIKISQSERAEAAAYHLKPLANYMAGRGVYVHVIKIPANASFWKRYPYEHGTLDTSQPCMLLYIGCTIRSFGARVGDEHMRAEYRLKNPSLHYAAMDEPGSEHQWYLLGQAKEDTDQAIIRITEAAAIACIHTYTSIMFSEILKRYGIVENTSTARGLNRTSGVKDWGAKTMDSALQMILHQRLLEEYGGDGWTFQTLPLLLSGWLSAQEKKEEIQRHLERAVENGMSLSQAFARRMKQLGAKACQDVRLAKSVQRVLSGGTFRLGHSDGSGRVGFFIFGLRAIPVRHPCARIGDEVSVHFIVSEGTHPLRFAMDALQDDPGRRLAILVFGHDTDGCEWQHWCRVNGEKYAMKANTYFDFITGTGSALIEDDLPRRCYFKKPYGLRYTGESTGTAVTRAIEELDAEESLALQQDHEGNLILDTPPKRTAKEGMQDIGTTGNETRVLNDPTQTTKTLKRTAPPHEVAVAPPKKAKRSELAETKPPQLTQSPKAQVFLEADLQEILGNTDLFQCFETWVRKQGAVYKAMTTVIITSTKVALNFRSNLKRHQTCWESFRRLSDRNLGLVYLRLCKMKETDDREALL